jgi:nucleotide-binding universal stress UspA family protein
LIEVKVTIPTRVHGAGKKFRVSDMEIKDIIVFLRPGEASAARLAVAARVAREHGALVSGICLVAEPELALADCFVLGPKAVDEALRHRDERRLAAAAPLEAAFQAAIADHGLGAGWSVSGPDESCALSAFRARLADLAVSGRPARQAETDIALVEKIVLESGAPCMMVPEVADRAARRFERVLLAWDGSRAAKRAMDDGLEFLRRASAVELFTIEERYALWTEEAGTLALQGHLHRHGVNGEIVREVRTKASVGRQLLDRCAAFGADLLIMGAYGHSPVAERMLGGTTRAVLTGASIPVLLSH